MSDMKTANLGGKGKTVIDKHVSVSISIHPDQRAKLKLLAAASGCSVSAVLQTVIDDYIFRSYPPVMVPGFSHPAVDSWAHLPEYDECP